MEKKPQNSDSGPEARDPLPAAACRTMEDVRRQIDGLDRQLVRLMALRQGYIEAAARIKSERTAVRDPARIEDVVANVVAYGREMGLSASIAEPVWRELIERSIQHELDAFDSQGGEDS